MPGTVNQTRPAPVDELRQRLGFWLKLDPSRLLWPGRCLVCGDAGADGVDLCEACLAELPWNRRACTGCALPLAADSLCGDCLQRRARLARRAATPLLAQVRAACVYVAPLDRLLPRFKFHQDLAAGRLLAQLMAQALAGAPRPDAIVAVPLHRARLRQRGFDQALELARPLARALGLPLRADALLRVRHAAAQSTLDAQQRARNLRHAYTVRPDAGLPAHVALVDDVMTTGATLEAAARALHAAGVARVDAWVCARAP